MALSKSVSTQSLCDEVFDVFVSCSYEDLETCRQFVENLKALNLRCFNSEENFMHGDTIPANIQHGIKCSRKLLLLVSHKWVTSRYAQMESECAKLKDHKLLNHLPVLIDSEFDENHTDFPKDLVIVKLYRYDNTPEFWKELAQDIYKDMPLSEVAPWGDVAHGLAAMYNNGFLQVVLHRLSDAVEVWNDKWQGKHPDEKARVVKRLFVVCPKTCSCDPKVSAYSNVSKIDDQVIISNTRAGNNRKYNLDMYRVTGTSAAGGAGDDGSGGTCQEFLVPMTMNWTMKRMFQMAGDQTFEVSMKHMLHQAVIFVDKLTTQLAGNNKVDIVDFDDVTYSVDSCELANMIIKKCVAATT